MRTTIRIDEELLKRVKQRALQQGKTLTAVIEDALRESLARKMDTQQREPVRLETFAGEGLQPGVNLDDFADLLDLMESDRDSD